MPEDWLAVDENLLLARISDGSDTFPCVWGGEPVGESAVVILPSDDRSRYALLALRNVDGMQEALERVHDEETGTTLSPTDYVRFEANPSERSCAMCDETIETGAPQVGIDVLMSRPQYIPSSAVAIHEQCVEQFNNSLDGVWENSDVLLQQLFDDSASTD